MISIRFTTRPWKLLGPNGDYIIDSSMYIRREAYMLEFFAYQTIGMTVLR